MKGREKQRKNRKRKEEQLNMKNNMGILDPTPYYAVLHMRHGKFYTQKQQEGGT
jgi:hypothetical protein